MNNIKAMIFAKFVKKDGVSIDEIMTASLKFQKNFIANQEGVSFHCLLSNLKGELADVVFAEDQNTLTSLMSNFEADPHAKSMMELIDGSSVKHYQSIILKEGFAMPEYFSCLEFGTFCIKDKETFNEEKMLNTSNEIEETYLNNHAASLGHFMGRIDDLTYSEVAFGTSIGHTKSICYGYLENSTCQKLLNMYDPKSMDLDFWYPLA